MRRAHSASRSHLLELYSHVAQQLPALALNEGCLLLLHDAPATVSDVQHKKLTGEPVLLQRSDML
jgi:hypothetical protein